MPIQTSSKKYTSVKMFNTFIRKGFYLVLCTLSVKASTLACNQNNIIEPLFNEQWYLHKNNVFYANNNIHTDASIHFGTQCRYSGNGIKIAIIDDGLDTAHPELSTSIAATYDISTDSANVSHTHTSDYHGTAVTGVIAANDNGVGLKGLASKSSIMFLKHKENMSDAETITLFQKAAAWGADIINCSWGTYDVSDAVKETIQNLAQNGRGGKGTVIVFAAGNDSQDIGNDESSIPEVIAVGASDIDNQKAWYSNHGTQLDVLAPGGYDVGITTIDPLGTSGAGTLSNDYLKALDGQSFIGTSASTPIVAGVIALMLEQNPNMTLTEVTNALHTKSDKIGSIAYTNGHNNYYGYGKINVEKLLNYVDTDGDGIEDRVDTDDDNDGVLDAHDAFPLDFLESIDTDHDGIGNNADLDDDNDGLSDKIELVFNLNPLNGRDASADHDNDGFSNGLEIGLGTNMYSASSKPSWVPIMMGDLMTIVPVSDTIPYAEQTCAYFNPLSNECER